MNRDLNGPMGANLQSLRSRIRWKSDSCEKGRKLLFKKVMNIENIPNRGQVKRKFRIFCRGERIRKHRAFRVGKKGGEVSQVTKDGEIGADGALSAGTKCNNFL